MNPTHSTNSDRIHDETRFEESEYEAYNCKQECVVGSNKPSYSPPGKDRRGRIPDETCQNQLHLSAGPRFQATGTEIRHRSGCGGRNARSTLCLLALDHA